MCEPTTLAIAALSTAAVGTGVSIYGQVKAGKNAKAAANAEAASMERQAAYQEAVTRDAYERLRGRQATQVAKSGRAMAGSALDVLADSAMEAEIEAQAIRTGAAEQASATRTAGKQALTNAYWGAAATGISGASSILGAAGVWSQLNSGSSGTWATKAAEAGYS